MRSSLAELGVPEPSGQGALSGLVETIALYACGPANTRKGFQNSAADGVRFCRELAAIIDDGCSADGRCLSCIESCEHDPVLPVEPPQRGD